jgi:hypothetical protein
MTRNLWGAWSHALNGALGGFLLGGFVFLFIRHLGGELDGYGECNTSTMLRTVCISVCT